MRRNIGVIATVTGAMALVACAVVPPSGPTVMALPGQGKTFDTFQRDDYVCRAFAQQQTGNPVPSQAATNSAVGSAIVGTALGAGLGAAIGAATGTAATGAAIGAGAGLLAGTVAGANNAAGVTQAGLQQSYDIAYTQCMYGHGNSVQSPPPVYAGYGPGWGGWGPGYVAPSVVVGFGGWGCCGWGWGGWGGGWRGGWGGGWRGGWGGGGGWHR